MSGTSEEFQDAVSTDLRGERFEVSDLEHGVCSGCGEIYLSLDAGELLQKRVVALGRAARGLLGPDETRALRQGRR